MGSVLACTQSQVPRTQRSFRDEGTENRYSNERRKFKFRASARRRSAFREQASRGSSDPLDARAPSADTRGYRRQAAGASAWAAPGGRGRGISPVYSVYSFLCKSGRARCLLELPKREAVHVHGPLQEFIVNGPTILTAPLRASRYTRLDPPTRHDRNIGITDALLMPHACLTA